MQDLREYRIRYDVTASAIAKQMTNTGHKVSKQYINQIELGIGNNYTVSEETKRRYLQALYEIVQARQGE